MPVKYDLANNRAHLHGIFPPILTPMTPSEAIDLASMKRLVDYLITKGVHGLWVMGTTGEFPSFDVSERARGVEAAISAANGRVPVVVNVGDCSTRLVLRHAENALKAGADAIAVTPPYYYPNSQDELLAHFRLVREKIDLPLLIYNIPQTVKTKTEVATALKLAEEGTVIGIKDSQNDLDWFRQVMVGAQQRGLDFRGFLGTRFLIDAAQTIGGHGSIPSMSNVVPSACVQTYEAARRGDWAGAAKHQERVMAVERISKVAQGGCPNAALFSAMKTILAKQGVIAHNTLSAPLRQLTAAEVAKLEAVAAELEMGSGY
ncbi:MAG: dihydrodipicolinate synthase family protein [Chloroflexota bacterium]